MTITVKLVVANSWAFSGEILGDKEKLNGGGWFQYNLSYLLILFFDPRIWVFDINTNYRFILLISGYAISADYLFPWLNFAENNIIDNKIL